LINKLKITLETIQQLKDKFISETESVIKDFGKFKSLSENQINWKPSAENWSIAECVDHLIVTNKLYFNEFEKQFAERQINTDCSNTKVKHKWLSKFITKSVDPNNIKKVKTFRVFMPSRSKHSKDIFNSFNEVQNGLINLVSTAMNLDLNKYVMSSPAAKIIKENFCDVLEIIRLHDRRHFNQAERLLNHPNFPKN
jgi:hypothetical protein